MTTAVKICGMTDETSLDAALAGGVDYIGLVFFPKSPRHLDLARAKALRAMVPQRSLQSRRSRRRPLG